MAGGRALRIVGQTLREARADNLTGEAAKVAYYLFLSLFPLLLLLLALAGLFGGSQALAWLTAQLLGSLPAAASPLVEAVLGDVRQTRPDVLSIGLLLTLWAASGGMAGLADGLNRMYDIEEGRSWWRKRAVAMGLLLAAIFLALGGAVAIVAGPEIGRALGLGGVWNVLRWPLAFALLTAQLWLIYYFLPNREQAGVKRETLLGALLGAGLWLAATSLFRLYVSNFGSYTETYGAIGAVIVLMLWLYITALAVLFGGELAAILEARGRAGSGRPERQPEAEPNPPARGVAAD